MGKDLHSTILPFIISRIKEHQNVVEILDTSTDDYYILRVQRNRSMRDMIVVISDSYYFGEFDYYSKPKELNGGGFILIARPEASVSSEVKLRVDTDKTIIGGIGTLLGALRKDEFWTYEKPKADKKK
jgi:hypothetical protein